MPLLRSCLFALWSLLCLSSASAQQTAQQDPQALSILAQSFTAMGGQNLAAIHDTRTVVQFSSAGDAGAYAATITTRGSTMLRVDSQPPEGSYTLVIASDYAASQEAGQPVKVYPRLSFGCVAITHLPVITLLSQLSNPAAKIQYAGLEPDGNSALHHVSIQCPLNPADGLGDYDAPIDIYIDSGTLLTRKISSAVRAPSNLKSTVPIQALYGDYRAVTGILVPFLVQYTLNGNPDTQQQVTTFSVNVSTSQTDFTLR